MTIRLDQTARQILQALESDYAGMPECDDGQGAHWARLVERAARSHALYDSTFYRYLSRRIAGLGARAVLGGWGIGTAVMCWIIINNFVPPAPEEDTY